MKNEFQPLDFFTPIYEEDRPVFPESPTRFTPFFLYNMKDWHWTVNVQALTLQYLMHGHIVYELNGRAYEATKGTCFLFKPGQHLDGRSLDGKPVTMFAAHFLRLPELQQSDELIHAQIREVSLFEAVAEHAVKCRLQNKPLASANIETSLKLLFALLNDNLKLGNISLIQRKVEDLIEQIKYNPGNDWRVEVMCETTGLSRSQLTRWFNRITGNPPNRFVIKQRIALAVQMLGTTSSSISEIADALGYRDTPFFIRQFRKETGVSPGNSRKQAML